MSTASDATLTSLFGRVKTLELPLEQELLLFTFITEAYMKGVDEGFKQADEILDRAETRLAQAKFAAKLNGETVHAQAQAYADYCEQTR